MMRRNLDLGMGKMGKKYMERERESIPFNKLLYIIINVFCILNKIFRVPWLVYLYYNSKVCVCVFVHVLFENG